jgi:hypothetical protein
MGVGLIEQSKVRSWVQILPPGPSFPVIELWEQVAGCSKTFSPHDLGCIYMTPSLFTLAQNLKL